MSADAPRPMSPDAPRPHYQLTFIVLAVGVGAYALLQSLMSPVLSLLQTELHTTQNTVTWVLTAYLLSASVCTPILGRIGDIMGKEKVLVAVLATLAVGSILAAFATSISVMIVARAIQGVGGGVIPLAFGIIRDEFPREKVAGSVGSIAALLGLGGGLGLVVAGPIVNVLNYHWLFWIPGGIVAAAAVATYFFIPESTVRAPGKVNWTPAVLLSGWLVALLIGVSEAPEWGWTAPSVIGLFVLAIVLAGAWIVVEQRSKQPLIDLRMMRIPAVWTANLVALLFGVGLYSLFAFMPEFLQTPPSAGYGFGSSVTMSGLIALPMSVSMFFAGAVSGRLSERYSGRTQLIVGSLISVPALLMMTFAHDYAWEFAVASLVVGAGFGLAFAALSNIIVDAVPASQTSVASGMNANIRTIGGAIGASVMASIVTANAQSSGLPRESGYTNGFAMLAGAMVLATAASLLIPTVRRVRGAEQRQDVVEPERPVLAARAVSDA